MTRDRTTANATHQHHITFSAGCAGQEPQQADTTAKPPPRADCERLQALIVTHAQLTPHAATATEITAP